MQNPNPIKFSDLISPDNSINELIGQLNNLIAKYEELKTKISGNAAELAKSLKDISGATESQREAIAKLTTESEKLAKEYEKVDNAERTAYRERQKAIQATKEQERIDKLIVELNRSKEGSYNRLSAQYRLNKIRLNEMSDAERYATETGRKLEAETNAIYEKMNKMQLATGKAQLQVGHYERALGNALGVNTRFVSALTDSGKAAETFSGIIKALAGPIGIVIGVVAGLTAAFKLFKESIHATQTTGDEFDYAMGEWTGIWAVFKKAVSDVDFSGFIRGAREAAEAGRNLKMVLDETFERTNSAQILRASMSQENAVLEEKLRSQQYSLDERIQAGKDYLANMKPIYDQEVETARRNRDAQLDYLFDVTNRQQYASEEAKKAAKERLATYIRDYNINEANIKIAQKYLQAEKDVTAAEDAMRKAQTVTMNEYYDNQRKTAQARIDSASKETKKLAGILKQYNLASNEEIKAYVQSEKDYLNAQAAAYNDNKRIVTMTNNLEAQKTKEAENAAKDRAAKVKKAEEERTKSEKEEAEKRKKIQQDELAVQRNILNAKLQATQLELSTVEKDTKQALNLRLRMNEQQMEIELFENRQKEEKLRQDEDAIRGKYYVRSLQMLNEYNQKVAQRDLAATQEIAKREFDMLNKNERQKTLYRLDQEEKRLNEILRINETATEKMTATEVKAVQTTINAIRAEKKRLGYNNLYEVLGLSITPEQQTALNTAINSVKSSIGSLIDKWQQAADAARSTADAQVEATQKMLEAEMEARRQGYASREDYARKELALAKSQQEAAIAEQRKAQQAQESIDTLTQASSLVTASANLWKTLSVLSPAAAIAGIAIMWGSFAAAKIKAAEMTKSVKYGEGTVELLQGGSHASGHDIDLGTRKDGTRRRAEGGEYFAVINKRNSAKYGALIPEVINSLNNGTFAERFARAGDEMAGAVLAMSGRTDVSGLERDVRAIRQQGDESRMQEKGWLVIRHKNLIRKIKS